MTSDVLPLRALRIAGRIVLAFCLVESASCAHPDPASPPSANWLIDGSPTDFLDLSEQTLRRTTPVAVFVPATALTPGWTMAGGRRAVDGICLAPEGGTMELSGPATAAMVGSDRLEIELKGLLLTPVELDWAVDDGPAHKPARRFWADAGGPNRTRIGFPLAEVAAGRREGNLVRLRFLAEADRELCLQGVVAVTDGRDEGRLAELAKRPWRVDLDGEVRSARLSPLGGAIEVALAAPTSGIRIGFGRLGKSASAFVFRAAVSAGGTWRELLAERWEAAEPEGWRDREIAVSGVPAGARLRLEAVAEGEPGLAVPVWSHVSAIASQERGSRPNVVLISIDTLRADRLSIYGAERETSPGLDSWARRRAIVFENAIVQAPWTLPSHASMLSGLEVFHHAAIFANPIPQELVLIQERLARAGYRTRAVTGAAYLDPRYGFSRGFDRYIHWTSPPGGNEIESGVQKAMQDFEELKGEPFFLFFHTYEVHGPYRAHQPYFSRFSTLPSDRFVVAVPTGTKAPGGLHREHVMMMFPPGDRELQVPLPPALAALPLDLYDSGVASADAQVSRLLQRLDELGLSERTLVIVTSDHGEALGEHGVGGHGFLYDDTLKVPLMVALPARRGAGRRIPQQVRSIDIVPTILEVAGLEPAPGLDGRSLLSLIEGRPVESGREAFSYSGSLGLSLRLGNRAKLLFWDGVVAARSERDRFFDLARDPAELVDHLPTLSARAALQNRALARLRLLAGGLRIGLLGAPDSAVTFRLEAPWLSGEIVKWTANPTDDVRWPDPHRLEISLPPGASAEILVRLTAPPSPRLNVEIEEAGETLRGELDVAATTATGGRTRGSRVRGGIEFAAAVASRSGFLPGIEVEWLGSVGAQVADPALTDSELEGQLKALGYLN